jgi:hypothetical protein
MREMPILFTAVSYETQLMGMAAFGCDRELPKTRSQVMPHTELEEGKSSLLLTRA